MALKNIRIGTDQRFALSLSNAGAKVNMNDVEVLHLCMYSVDQRSNDGSIGYAVNADDATVLDLLWPAKSQSYLGSHSVHGTIRYAGAVASFDIPAVNVVSKTSEADISTDTIVLEAPVGTEELTATITIQGIGPQGPQGDKMTYADLTQEDKKDLYEGVSEVMRPLLDAKQSALTDTDGGYGQRVAELEKEGIASQAKLSELDDIKGLFIGKDSVNLYNWEFDKDLIPNQPRDSNHLIEIPIDTKYIVATCTADGNVYGNFTKVYCYDYEKVIIKENTSFDSYYFGAGDWTMRQGRGFTLPEGTKYIRLRYHFGHINRETVMVEAFKSKPLYNDLSQEYEPFGKKEYTLAELKDYIKKEDVADLGLITPKIHNPKVSFSTNLRILDIGNSFTEDTVWFVDQLISSAGLDVSNMCLYTCVRGSGSFKTWYDMYKGTDTSSEHIRRRFGGVAQSFVDSGDVSDNGASFREILQDNKWDVILIHQVSNYSCDYSLWEGKTAGGYLKEFVRLLKINQPQATIGMYMPHISYQQASGDTQKLWADMAETTKKAQANYGIDFIVPIATAIEMVRASVVNTSPYGMSRDKHHLASGLGRYTASCVYYQSVIAPMFGKSILGNTARWTPAIDGEPSETINVTDTNAPIAQKAAIFACSDFFSLIDVDNTEL